MQNDLALVSVGSLISLVLALLTFGGWAKAIALVPMVLFLPGYALAAAMFPPGSIPRSERCVYIVGLSVGAATLGGLLWQLVLNLDRNTWAVLLTLVTLVGCAVAWRGRAASTSPKREIAMPSLPRVGPLTALAVLAALALAIAAVNIAIDGIERQRGMSHFSSLWMVPRSEEAGSIEVGVWNHMGNPHQFRLSVERKGAPLRTWNLRLGPDQRLQRVLSAAELPGRGMLVVTLYRDGKLYRRTKLDTGVGA
ncbi:MAG: DUF1616 domain-containing protein [Candidatus Limnocylindria bacterium]